MRPGSAFFVYCTLYHVQAELSAWRKCERVESFRDGILGAYTVVMHWTPYVYLFYTALLGVIRPCEIPAGVNFCRVKSCNFFFLQSLLSLWCLVSLHLYQIYLFTATALMRVNLPCEFPAAVNFCKVKMWNFLTICCTYFTFSAMWYLAFLTTSVAFSAPRLLDSAVLNKRPRLLWRSRSAVRSNNLFSRLMSGRRNVSMSPRISWESRTSWLLQRYVYLFVKHITIGFAFIILCIEFQPAMGALSERTF
jgi:hypothetical protein